MEEKHNFCVKCGISLDDSDRFCPNCGERVPGMNPEQVAEEKETIRGALDSRMKWHIIMMMLYAVPFLFLGIYIMYNSDFLVDFIMENPIEGMDLTEDLVVQGVKVLAVAYLISALSAVVSSVCCYKKKYYWVAVVTCFISMFTGIAGFFALFMGMFALLQIITSKLGFEEYSEQLESELNKIR